MSRRTRTISRTTVWTYRSIVAWLLLVAGPCAGATHNRPPARQRVPAIANLAGVRVGVDTMDRAERPLGRGKVITGAQPQGARAWGIRHHRWVLFADGFWSATTPIPGIVVESLSLQDGNSSLLVGGKVPELSPGRLHVGFWRFLPLGASYGKTVRLLTQHGLHPYFSHHTLTVTAGGYVRKSRKLTYTDWWVDLCFSRGRLDSISAQADARVHWSVQD